jgi:hypothetical protein
MGGGRPNRWAWLVGVQKNYEKKKPVTEWPMAYICFGEGHRQSG